ncbi:CAP domain-containing protein [Pendulispora rubella]|uniref:CAP domain-containing protein n=1 Tax=Pendulispora rubella TaxID=2741070 RepID=A0ABZ2KV34_9BACT
MVAASAGCEGAADSDSPSTGDLSTETRGNDPPPALADLDEARRYNLDRVNAYRAEEGVPPLVLDETLNAFAQAASEQLSADHVPHKYFKTNVYKCNCNLGAENQGAPNGWRWRRLDVQIEQILAQMMISPGHRKNMLNPEYKRLGIGFVNPGENLYFTNDFGR